MNIKNKTKKIREAKNAYHMSKKGFSLVEVLIAIFVFSIVIAMLAGSFSSFMKNYSNSKKSQRDIENAQYAMNLMAKTIRTSEVNLVSNSTLIKTYDYSQSKCIKYQIDTNTNKVQSIISNQSVPATNLASCMWGGLPVDTVNNLTSSNIVGSSSFISATPTTGSVYGKTTIVLSVRDQSNTTSAIPIQMTVSLRQ